MNVFLLYLILLKANLVSFSGLSSLPVVHEDLVVRHPLITERQLNTAIAAGRSGPGPLGLYMVSIGYLVAGMPGAVAGYAAVVTPAFLILPLLRFFAKRASNPVVRGAIRGVLLAAAGLLLASALPIGRATVTGWLTGVVAAVSFLVLAFTKVETMWVVVGSAAVGLVAAMVGWR